MDDPKQQQQQQNSALMLIKVYPLEERFYFSKKLPYKYICVCVCSTAQSCVSPCNPMDCSLPDSSVHRIIPTRITELVDISFSRGSSLPRDWTHISCCRQILNHWAISEAHLMPMWYEAANYIVLHHYSHCTFFA